MKKVIICVHLITSIITPSAQQIDNELIGRGGECFVGQKMCDPAAKFFVQAKRVKVLVAELGYLLFDFALCLDAFFDLKRI